MKHDVDFEELAPPDSAYRPPGRLAIGLTVLALGILVAFGAVIWHLGGIPISPMPGIKMSARRGNPQAQFLLAMTHLPDGSRPDAVVAVRLLTAAAEQDHVEAQYALATVLYTGMGVPQNVPEAVKWIRRAAESGQRDAQVRLASLYERGEYLPIDQIEAIKWYQLAAEQNEVAAQYNLANLYRSGRGTPEDPVLAAKWLRRAADNGLKVAKQMLAVCYRDGYGVERDLSEAQRLLDEANKLPD